MGGRGEPSVLVWGGMVSLVSLCGGAWYLLCRYMCVSDAWPEPCSMSLHIPSLGAVQTLRWLDSMEQCMWPRARREEMH